MKQTSTVKIFIVFFSSCLVSLFWSQDFPTAKVVKVKSTSEKTYYQYSLQVPKETAKTLIIEHLNFGPTEGNFQIITENPNLNFLDINGTGIKKKISFGSHASPEVIEKSIPAENDFPDNGTLYKIKSTTEICSRLVAFIGKQFPGLPPLTRTVGQRIAMIMPYMDIKPPQENRIGRFSFFIDLPHEVGNEKFVKLRYIAAERRIKSGKWEEKLSEGTQKKVHEHLTAIRAFLAEER